jgi:hypothetical protein
VATDKDKFIVMAAKVLKEFMELTEVDWDEAFFRFVKYSSTHVSVQFSYIFQRKLIMGAGKNIDKRKKREYQETLQNLMKEVFIDIEKEDKKEPLVAVLKVTGEGNYNVKFDYEDTNALEINLIRLGLDNSYFTVQDVDIPENVKEFQKEMAEAEGK